MGIKYLTSFIERNYRWEKRPLTGKLVFDGSATCHELYHSNNGYQAMFCGGQYGEFRADVKRFFDQLCDGTKVEPIFLFDGIYNQDQKMEAILARQKQRMESIHAEIQSIPISNQRRSRYLPLLAKELFYSVLDELKIQYFVVDGEADPNVVALANHFQCPVVSNDSDYFVFNVEAGYIPFSRLNSGLKHKPLQVEFFSRNKFCRQFRFASPEICLAIPMFLGNDFLVPKQTIKAHELISFLSSFETVEELFVKSRDEVEMRENYRKVVEFYTISNTVTIDSIVSDTTLKFQNGDSIPDWVIKQYHKGQFAMGLMQMIVFNRDMLPIIPDDTTQETAFDCSVEIRKAIYGVLSPKLETVNEYVRRKLEPCKERVGTVKFIVDKPLPSIFDLNVLSNEARLKFLQLILHCDLARVEKKWQLVVGSTYFWASIAKPTAQQVKALILSFVECSSCTQTQHGSNYKQDRSREWMKAFHVYAQWQCVYFDAMKLNNVLMNPLPHVSPAFLFDGCLVMHYATSYTTSVLDRIIDRLPQGRVLFDMLYSNIGPALHDLE